MDLNTKISVLCNVQLILKELTDYDFEIQQIHELVVNYIESNCVHNIVTDYIDVTPDYGHSIRYCDICMKTFTD
tara:strand:- start:318 stop:539 length:222 start_codon:yes stop_codon:yes gene_type:complete